MGFLEDVGVCAYFGHSQGAFQKLLALQSLYEDGLITQCYYITQTKETAELRHRLINPQARPGSMVIVSPLMRCYLAWDTIRDLSLFQ